MSRNLSFAVALAVAGAAGFSVAAAQAAERPLAGIDHASAVSQVRVHRARALNPAHTSAARPKIMGNNSAPTMPLANAFRAYPPSCVADPLPDRSSGPVYTARMDLYATNSAGTASGTEPVTVTIWRIACSSSGGKPAAYADGGPNAVTLLRIDRSAANEGKFSSYPTFPDVRIAQGNIDWDDPQQRDLVRVATEPNTIIADTTIDSPIIFSTTYVLENYPFEGAGFFQFNLGFDVLLDPLLSSGIFGQISVPDYAPTAASYPNSVQPLPINGHLNGIFYDTAHSGEGLNVQVLEGGSAGVLDLAWFTYDNSGIPFWIGGQSEAATVLGARQQAVTLFYTDGGGFAGNFGANVSRNAWGTMTVAFPDCNTIKFSYQARAGLPAGVPSSSGTRTWTRLANVNALTCE